MPVLYLNLLLYTVSGMWRPIEWTASWSKLLYSVYMSFTIYLMMFLMLTQLLDIIFIVNNTEDFASNFLMFLSVISALCKQFTAVIRRSQIVGLVETLQAEPCEPRDKEEMDIQEKFDRSIRSCSISYTALAAFSATGALAGGVLDTLQGLLPFRTWVPYDISSPLSFWLTSAQEMLAVFIGTLVNISTETLIFGFCLQTCAQLEILKHRLQRAVMPGAREEIAESSSEDAPKRTGILSRHISHHLCIIRYAKMLNEIFSQVFFTQFFASIVVLCSSVYHLSSHMTVADFATMVIYTFCMFVQIFVYCWAGNEVMLKSVELGEAVYQMNWILMTISDRKALLMIMKRSARPIKFTSSFLVTLSLDSYGNVSIEIRATRSNILKASYSAFNVLNRS